MPTKSIEKFLLNEAGLGIKEVSFPIDATHAEFKEIIYKAFPRLQEGGGFEFLKCLPNSKSLEVIPTSYYLPKHLKGFIGNGKVFIRPLQRSLDVCLESSDEVYFYCVNTLYIILKLMEKCLKCNEYIKLGKLKQHYEICK